MRLLYYLVGTLFINTYFLPDCGTFGIHVVELQIDKR